MGSCASDLCPFPPGDGSGNPQTVYTCKYVTPECTPKSVVEPLGGTENEVIGFAIHLQKLHRDVIPPGNGILRAICSCKSLDEVKDQACTALKQSQQFIIDHYGFNTDSNIYGGNTGEFLGQCIGAAITFLVC